MIKLYYSKASPYARKIRVLVEELKLKEQIVLIESHPFDDEKQLLNANPLGKVPVLEVDGKSIIDSVVICDYLFSKSSGEISKEKENYWEVRTQRAMAQGILDVAVAWRREHMRDENIRSQFWETRSHNATLRSLEWFNQRIDSIQVFPEISAITLACALEYLSFRHPQLDWKELYPKLVDWLKVQQLRASMKTTQPDQA